MTANGLLTLGELKALNRLLEDPQFKGKQMLRSLIWRNTNLPKYEIGKYVVASNTIHRVFERPIVNYNFKVIDIRSSLMTKTFTYELSGVFVNSNGKEATITTFVDECQISGYTDNDYNRVASHSHFAQKIAESDPVESLDVIM